MLLKEKIIDRIRSEGPINFEAFMEMALFYPGLGYYSREITRIGRYGDFYTSPHLHPIFGAMIGRQMLEMWEVMERQSFKIVEMGAGEGYLLKDMFDYFKAFLSQEARDFMGGLSCAIVEMNPTVRDRQRRLLDDYSEMIEWFEDIEDLDSFAGCFLSNELLDSFPVRLIEMDEELKEVFVCIDDDNNLMEIKRPGSIEARKYLEEFNITLPRGYRTEINLRIRDWLYKINKKLREGFIMTIDYGYSAHDYYSEERNKGTLLCYHNHRVNDDPFSHIGEQDITAHINFSSLKKWGEDIGFSTIGFCEQGPYLVSLGIDGMIKELCGDVPDPVQTAKIKGLLLPEGMGESHKVMIQYKGNRSVVGLKGFTLRNRVDWL